MTEPSTARYWVFDMDGTLTIAVHDFAAIRRALDIPADADILTHLDQLPQSQAAEKLAWLNAHEERLAKASQPAPGALELIQALHRRGCHLAILTRNDYQLVWVTLKAIGLEKYFAADRVLGRNDARPKPEPEGLLRIARQWQQPPRNLVMVGDHWNDMQCAYNAGATAVLVNAQGNLWPEVTDHYFSDCLALSAALDMPGHC